MKKVLVRIEYDPETKTVKVVLDNAQKREEVEAYFKQARILPHALTTLREFERLEIQPLDSLEKFKLALSELWVTTEVLVDWSRPADDSIQV